MASLRRTMAAGFPLADCCTLDEVQQQGEALLRDTDSLFGEHPAFHICRPRAEALCRNGNPFFVKDELPDGIYRVYGMDGAFLCLSRLQEGTMTSIKNFFGA